MIDRRDLLYSISIVGISLGAGCNWLGSEGNQQMPGGVYGNNRDDRPWIFEVLITELESEDTPVNTEVQQFQGSLVPKQDSIITTTPSNDENQSIVTEFSKELPAGEYKKLFQITTPGRFLFHVSNGHSTSEIEATLGASDNPDIPVRGTWVTFSIKGKNQVIASRHTGE